MDLDDSAVDDEEAGNDSSPNEVELQELLKVNSNKCIEHMQISSKEASRFDIPLCRMIYMSLVRPILVSDIKHLEAEFAHGYHVGASVFYVSICKKHGEERYVSLEDTMGWNKYWRNKSSLFESRLLNSPHLKHLQGKMFFVCDRNHKLKAWTRFINRMYSDNKEWHIFVDLICLDSRGKSALLLNAMHKINK